MYMLDTNVLIYAMKHPKEKIMDLLLAHTDQINGIVIEDWVKQ